MIPTLLCHLKLILNFLVVRMAAEGTEGDECTDLTSNLPEEDADSQSLKSRPGEEDETDGQTDESTR